MSKFLEKQSVISIVETYGDDDLKQVLSGLTEYNDDANRLQYGEWTDIQPWQLFEPSIDDDNIFNINKINFHTATCSNCKSNITIDDYDNYCPRCGAKMKYS